MGIVPRALSDGERDVIREKPPTNSAYRARRLALTLGDVMPSALLSACNLTRSQVSEFSSSGYLVVRNLVSAVTAARFEAITRSLPARRVICRIPQISWDEQSVPRAHALYELFASSPLKNAVTELLGGKVYFCNLTCWISRYRVGEHISRHTDAGGTLQILLMLKPVAAAQGGVLKLVTDSGALALDLREGDALLFRATSIIHFTTPLASTPECPDPIRVVAVGRYFFDDA